MSRIVLNGLEYWRDLPINNSYCRRSVGIEVRARA